LENWFSTVNFTETPEHLFFKEIILTHQCERIAPETAFGMIQQKGQLHLTRWKWFFEYLVAIRRVRMSWAKKARCYSNGEVV